jgi:hypothetical protein
MKRQCRAAGMLLAMAVVPTGTWAQARSMEDARFTGPLLTSSANAQAPGAFFMQPYLIHTRTSGSYDGKGDRHRLEERGHDTKLSVLMGYGISKRLTGELSANGGRSSSGRQHGDGLRFGDSSVRLKYVLRPGDALTSRMTVSAMLNQSLATGSHDRLGDNVLNGRGNGSYRTGLSLLGQQVLWMPNGRPLRWRWQANWSPSPGDVQVRGSSVYGTGAGFDGHASPGVNSSALLAMEYSINRNWVLAMDLRGSHKGRTTLEGNDMNRDGYSQWTQRVGRSSRSFSVAPAVEYIINDNVGVLAGVQASLPGGRNSASFVSPQVSMTLSF